VDVIVVVLRRVVLDEKQRPCQSASAKRFPAQPGFESPRLLLTNHHVLDSAAGARAHLVQLGYLSREDGTHLAPAEFALDPDLLFLTSPIDELDFTLVAVDPLNTAGARLESFGWSRLIAELGKGVQGERINIVHHPQGTAKGCPGVSVRRYAARNPRSRPV
jgi:hypothetical protein